MNLEEQTFQDIPVDRTEVDQSLLDIDQRTRTSTFAWNGQFSPQFIEALLDAYAPINCTAYDPFIGSGTVLHECALKRFEAYGVELNPAAFFMAKANEVSNVAEPERSALLKTIDSDINSLISSNITEESLSKLIESKDGSEKDIISLLVVLCDYYKNRLSDDLILSKWEALKETLQELPFSEKRIEVFNCDARHVPAIKTNSANLVITSPPYINVMNYHQQYRKSVESLGFNVLSVAKKEFGSNRANRGNRFYTVVQYCIDMALAIRETSRIARSGSRLIFVVGKESNILKTSFCNSELIFRICSEIFGLDFLLRQQRVFKNRFGKLIYEDILHFENRDLQDIPADNIESEAKRIAIDSLKSGLRNAKIANYPNSTIELIEKAIVKAPALTKS